MIYQFRKGHQFSRAIDPQVIGDRIARIRERLGVVTPEVVVEDARPPESPLHPAFEWDDRLAAEHHRKWQARHLLGAIVVVSETGEPTRAFVNVTIEEERSYEPIQVVMSDAELRVQYLTRALTEAKAWQARYSDLHELSKVFGAIERAEKKAQKGI